MKPVNIFRVLVIYILLQFAWWSYLLLELHQRKGMIIGEGLVFLSLLGWFSYRTMRAFKKEMELARMQKNILLSITHEFKSPLASIRLYLQTLLKHKNLDEEKKDSFIRKAIADTERLDTLVENTLLANQISLGSFLFNKEEVDLSDVVSQAVHHFKEMPERKNEINSDIKEGVLIKGDKLALRLLFNNLIENAIKYSPEGSSIKVQLEQNAVFSVADEGPGIPDNEKKKIFQKFYRIGNEEVRKTKGTGLGLYLSKYIAEQHHGIISVQDNHPKGSVFRVKLA